MAGVRVLTAKYTYSIDDSFSMYIPRYVSIYILYYVHKIKIVLIINIFYDDEENLILWVINYHCRCIQMI